MRLRRSTKVLILLAVSLCAVLATLALPPIAQDPGYHALADRRTFFGIRGFLDVATNAPFLLAGAFGLARLPPMPGAPLRHAYIVMCAGVILVALGSTWYHLAPSDMRLVWDRAPMTVVFMALFALVLGDGVSERVGARLLWPLVLAGLASVAWWQISEQRGQGDLRPYALIQFLPMALIPLMLLLFGATHLRTPMLWLALCCYVLAKLAEHFDAEILALTGLISGHSIKHLLSAAAALAALMAFAAHPDTSAELRRR
ncbi:MAG TPA: hypothetical protein VM616_10765 [Gammaproteobacteria bacterium]|nr:hypothetical protein [Gammaproteobacteria bacterium]